MSCQKIGPTLNGVSNFDLQKIGSNLNCVSNFDLKIRSPKNWRSQLYLQFFGDFCNICLLICRDCILFLESSKSSYGMYWGQFFGNS